MLGRIKRPTRGHAKRTMGAVLGRIRRPTRGHAKRAVLDEARRPELAPSSMQDT